MCENSDARFPFIVRAVYFQPTDAPDADDAYKEKISRLMLDTQDLYRQEMEKHGYGQKTFRLETRNDKVVVHIVKGWHDIAHYVKNGKTTTFIDELPDGRGVDLKNPNNVVVLFVGGADFFFTEIVLFGVDGFASCYDGFNCGGIAIVSQDPHMRVVAHELGHTFGLMHYFQSSKALMGRSTPNALELNEFEARWLDKHHYFNAIHNINAVPKISLSRKPRRATLEGKTWIEFNVTVESINGLHQVQLSRRSDGNVLGWAEVDDNRDTVQFFVMKDSLIHQHIRINNLPFVEDTILFQVLDIQGNHRMHYLPFTMPLEISSHQKAPLPWAKLKAKQN